MRSAVVLVVLSGCYNPEIDDSWWSEAELVPPVDPAPALADCSFHRVVDTDADGVMDVESRGVYDGVGRLVEWEDNGDPGDGHYDGLRFQVFDDQGQQLSYAKLDWDGTLLGEARYANAYDGAGRLVETLRTYLNGSLAAEHYSSETLYWGEGGLQRVDYDADLDGVDWSMFWERDEAGNPVFEERRFVDPAMSNWDRTLGYDQDGNVVWEDWWYDRPDGTRELWRRQALAWDAHGLRVSLMSTGSEDGPWTTTEYSDNTYGPDGRIEHVLTRQYTRDASSSELVLSTTVDIDYDCP